MNKLQFLFISILLVGLGSCGVTDGAIGHSVTTNVTLSEANYKVVASVSGEASVQSFFGIGMNKKNLVEQARRKMIDSADLIGRAKAIINVTTDVQTTVIFPWVKKTVVVSGEVIEFSK